MQINNFLKSEVEIKKRTHKKAWIALLCCLTSCAFMLILQVIMSVSAGLVFEYIDLDYEIEYLLQTIIIYCISFIIPFSVAGFIFKHSFKNPNFAMPQRNAPSISPLYVFGTLGVGYLVNFILTLCFSGFVERYTVDNDFIPETPLGIALMFIANAVLPAIFEEWAFRGVICKNLLPYGKNGAIIISSLLFGLVHIDPPRIIFATAVGVLFAICYEHTGSLKLSMMIHFLNNLFSTVVVLFVDDGNDEVASVGEVYATLLIYGMIACAVFAIIYYSLNGLSGKKISLKLPQITGYKLSTAKYLLLAIFNVGIIPLGAIYVILYLLSFHSEEILSFIENLTV